MENSKVLNEEKYQKTSKVILIIGIVILVIGLCLGGFLIYKGVAKPGEEKVEILRKDLEKKKKVLEDKGLVYDTFSKYTDGEKYDLKIITDVLNPEFQYCHFDEYKDNSITKEYCKAKDGVDEMSSSISIGAGVFICFLAIMLFSSCLQISKGRSILAYQVQQAMPVAKEGMEEMAPSVGKMAKEITKGIKEGIKEKDKK